jgi:uncharacterized phage protein (TIGR01671 family)
MREILFRGKRAVNGQWLFGGFHSRFDLAFIVGCSKSFRFDGMDVIPETVGQFTGLTDKNGTKIFEGDIVRYMNKSVMVVVWDKESASFVCAYSVLNFKHCATIINAHLYLEVIGNIHDNPELMETA